MTSVETDSSSSSYIRRSKLETSVRIEKDFLLFRLLVMTNAERLRDKVNNMSTSMNMPYSDQTALDDTFHDDSETIGKLHWYEIQMCVGH